MYVIEKNKIISSKAKFLNVCDLEKLAYFLLPSKNNVVIICNEKINNLNIFNLILIHPCVIKIVEKKYKKILADVTELLVSDDDSGDSIKLALTRMEKFRQEIKNKYRIFLEKEELNFMAKQLSILQKQAKKQLIELQNYLVLSDNNAKSGKNR